MMNISQNGSVYIVIDADNAQLKSLDIKHIIEFAKYFGNLKRCMAFGDWKKDPLRIQQGNYNLPDIELVQVNRIGKNATDNSILLNIGTLIAHDSDSSFVLVSGDGDFASISQFLKDADDDAKIIVIGNKLKTAKDLIASCDQFYFLEDLEQELLKIKTDYPIPPDEVRTFLLILLDAYHALTPEKWDWVSYNDLDKKWRGMFWGHERQFGAYPLSEWLKYLPNHFSIRDEMVCRIDPYPADSRFIILFKAYRQVVEKDNRATLSRLDEKLREMFGKNYEGVFGIKKLIEWVQDYPKYFSIDGDVVNFNKNTTLKVKSSIPGLSLSLDDMLWISFS